MKALAPLGDWTICGADEHLLLALQLHEFTGRPWDRFSRELARYGLGVLRVGIRRGTIYGKAKALTGYGLGRIEGWPDPQTVEALAAPYRHNTSL